MPLTYWERVGATLRTHRELSGWSNTNHFKAKHRSAPHVNTINDIEDGNPGSVKSLERYCEALRVRVEDVLRAALPESPTSGEAALVASMYDAADPKVRALVRETLRAWPPTRRDAETPGPLRTGAGTSLTR